MTFQTRGTKYLNKSSAGGNSSLVTVSRMTGMISLVFTVCFLSVFRACVLHSDRVEEKIITNYCSAVIVHFHAKIIKEVIDFLENPGDSNVIKYSRFLPLIYHWF